MILLHIYCNSNIKERILNLNKCSFWSVAKAVNSIFYCDKYS